MNRIRYVDKDMIFPHFGRAYPQSRIAYVRIDLPKRVKRFVAIHELFHLHDWPENWFWGEVKANLFAFVKEPIGGIGCILMTLTDWERVKYYARRLIWE